jgi:hypothetical protein
MTGDASLNPVLIRMARALASSQGRSDWQSFVSAAQASLRELREPSDDMLEAASGSLPDWGDLPADWRAMIDFVLGDAKAPLNDNLTAQSSTKAAS